MVLRDLQKPRVVKDERKVAASSGAEDGCVSVLRWLGEVVTTVFSSPRWSRAATVQAGGGAVRQNSGSVVRLRCSWTREKVRTRRSCKLEINNRGGRSRKLLQSTRRQNLKNVELWRDRNSSSRWSRIWDICEKERGRCGSLCRGVFVTQGSRIQRIRREIAGTLAWFGVPVRYELVTEEEDDWWGPCVFFINSEGEGQLL
jgi:hypothetical protein